MASRMGDREESSSGVSAWARPGLAEPGELALAELVSGLSSISEGDSFLF